PRVVRQRIETFLVSGRVEEAKALIQKTVDANPNDSLAMYYRGYLEFRQNDLDAAQRDFTTLRNRDQQNVNARLMLSKVLRAKGDMSGAITELEVALQQQPLVRDIRMNLLDLYAASDPPRWDSFDRAI